MEHRCLDAKVAQTASLFFFFTFLLSLRGKFEVFGFCFMKKKLFRFLLIGNCFKIVRLNCFQGLGFATHTRFVCAHRLGKNLCTKIPKDYIQKIYCLSKPLVYPTGISSRRTSNGPIYMRDAPTTTIRNGHLILRHWLHIATNNSTHTIQLHTTDQPTHRNCKQ